MISPLRRSLALSVAVTAAVSLAACSGSNSKKPASSSSAAPTSTSAAPPVKSHKVNPLTGQGKVPTTPVISAKIDDTESGRPQLGIDKADIVYIEAVEGGLTRLAAIYGTYKPTVGYIRSTRPSDPDLLLQFGKITAVYSGGAHDSLPLIRKSGITSWAQDAGKPYFTRRPHANDHGYINVTVDLAQVAAHTHTNKPKSIGWTFNPSLSGMTSTRGTDVRTEVTGSYTHGTAVEFRWDAKLKKYVRYINGVRQVAADGKPVTATNVIVQSCRVVAHPQDSDVLGNPSQFTYTVGGGAIAVFRNGRRIDGTWSRPHVSNGTALRTKDGKALPLMPGNTWVVLIRNGVGVSS
jgi:hypothetical protein